VRRLFVWWSFQWERSVCRRCIQERTGHTGTLDIASSSPLILMSGGDTLVAHV